MLKITRSTAFIPAPLQECPSPKLSASPKLVTSTIKRGFKKNSSAAFLCKKFGMESKSSENSEESTPLASKELNSDFSQHKPHLRARNQGGCHDRNQADDSEPVMMSETIIDEEANRPQKCYRVMVIGSRNTGKRSFVNSLFSSDECSPSSYKQSFDLITKIATEGSFTKRYNFYLKEQDDAQKDYKSILNFYYQACSAIFLIYNPDREDFLNQIEKELQALKNALYMDSRKQNKQSIVLIANNQGENSEVKINMEEFERLKERYDIKLSFELNNVSQIKETILNAIEKLKECNL